MRRMYKYEIPAWAGTFCIDMPVGTEVKYVAMQHGALCLWGEVFQEGDQVNRTFFVRGTGHDIGRDLTYVGTALDASRVWHVYEQE
jgi:hypothetical protein